MPELPLKFESLTQSHTGSVLNVVSGFRVYGSGFRVLGFRVQGLGFRVQDLGFRVQGLGCKLQGLGSSSNIPR